MKCQKCKAEIPEGKIYCENCGAAIQMVPDYNPVDDITIETEEKSRDFLISTTEDHVPVTSVRSYCRKYWIAGIALILLGFSVFRMTYDSVRMTESVTSDMQFLSLLEKPTFSITPGMYDYSTEVAISHAEHNNGTIYYTTDGTTPDERSPIYRSPIQINEGLTIIRAVFIRFDGTSSEEADGTYEVVFDYPAEPVFSMAGGTYTQSFRVTITAEPDCKIYYTTNGEEPGPNTRLYRGSIEIPFGLTVLQAVAVDEEGGISGIVEAIYNIQ
ncbi:MAG: chitobiase/beta-hexosaminidase C-terminal domain-containing protein [Lachnospiraceae bacterium]|nr:chitobiase/beta-hexosaminidase C-terminal domain-containing protein [Lachnospiraceae bacterium]